MQICRKMTIHHDFGKKSEDRAVSYLQSKGYEILARNWRFGRAEIDIIARKENELVIVEVKARSTGYFGNPAFFVSRKKIKMMTEAAHEFSKQISWEGEIRFDIISIVQNQKENTIEHLENAFYWF